MHGFQTNFTKRTAHPPPTKVANQSERFWKVVPKVWVMFPLQAPLQPVASANTGVNEGTSTGQQAPDVLRFVLRRRLVRVPIRDRAGTL